MEETRPSLPLAGAGMVLIGYTAAVAVLGLLIGWAAGSLGVGFLIGIIVGIPAGIAGVYRRYRKALS
jgi:hypothetical protein